MVVLSYFLSPPPASFSFLKRWNGIWDEVQWPSQMGCNSYLRRGERGFLCICIPSVHLFPWVFGYKYKWRKVKCKSPILSSSSYSFCCRESQMTTRMLSACSHIFHLLRLYEKLLQCFFFHAYIHIQQGWMDFDLEIRLTLI
jgi:hypothetical protein